MPCIRFRPVHVSAVLSLVLLPVLPQAVAAEQPADTADPVEVARADSVRAWLSSTAVRLRTVEAGSGFEDMQPLRDIVGDARIVTLGEPTHGNREVFQLKHRMLEFLVTELGFNVFALESPMPETAELNEYVLTGRGDPAKALAGIYVWVWDTEEVLDMIEWMREYNADPAHTRKLTFYGFDMQSPERAARVTLEYLGQVDTRLNERAREHLGSIAIPFSDPETNGYRPFIPREADDSAVAAINLVLESFDHRKDSYVEATSVEEWSTARQHASVLAQWIRANHEGGADYDQERDDGMAENVRWILDHEGPEAKLVIWAHNSHLTAQENRGTTMLGKHLRRMCGSDVVSFGFFFDRGGFRAWEATVPSRGPRNFSVGPAPGGTLEAMLASAGLEIAAVDLRRIQSGAVAEWFKVPILTRHSGGGYNESAPEEYFWEYVVPKSFDAVVFVDSTRPVRTLNPSDYAALPVVSAPVNLNFESGDVRAAPEGWIAWSKLRRFGYEVVTSAEQPYSGSRSAMIRRQPGKDYGEVSGSMLQRLDASAYRGKTVRLRAAARAEVPSGETVAFVRLQIQPAPSGDVHGIPEVIFDSLDEHRVDSAGWRMYEIVADVPENAGVISYGLFLASVGAAWLDEVSVEIVQR